MDSIRVNTSPRTADQLLVSDNVIKLELSSKSKKATSSISNPVPPFVSAPEVNPAAYNVPLTSSSVNSPYPNLNHVSPVIATEEACSVANFDVGRLRYFENSSKDHLEIYGNKPAEETKPVLSNISFINDLVPKKHELRSSSLDGKESHRSIGTPPLGGGSRDVRNYGDSCTLKDLPSGSTEADFGIVKEELNIEDIEEGAGYSCLASHSSVSENLFSGILPDVIEPFMKGTETESLLKTDLSMNENVTQENVPQMLDLLNKPTTKPIRRQRVKKTPKLGARLSSVISKLAQSKETLILSKSNASNPLDSTAQQIITSKTSSETSNGSSSVQSDNASARLVANTAPFRTTVPSLNNAQVLSPTTNQCLENSVINKCDEISQPLATSISASPDSLDGTKSSLVVDRLKRLGTSIVVESSSTETFESITVRRPAPVESNKVETSITIESQPFVSTRSLNQPVPSTKVVSPKLKTAKKTAKSSIEPVASVSVTPSPIVVPEPVSAKARNVKVSVSSDKTIPAVETNQTNLKQNLSPVAVSDDLSSPQYKNCLNMLESFVKADDLVKDITKNCIKNKTNRKINKNVLKYDSKLSKNNWKSNLVSNDSSPPKTTLIINKTIPLKTKIKITHSHVDETSSVPPQTEPTPNKTESSAVSQKIDGEIVKVIMDKHNFTIGDSSIIEMPNGQKMYTCDVCSGVYQKGFSLKRHYLRSHINYHFIRVKESETTSQFLTIQLSGGPDDNGGVDPSKVLLFRCHVCGNCFPSKSELKEHLMAHPPVNSISNNDTKVYKCINCSSVFNRKKEFSKHRKTCVIEVPAPPSNNSVAKQRLNEKLLCLFCAKVFPSVVERKKHGLKMHHWKKKIHQCFKCPETFQFQTLVYQHLREIHRNDYFSCAPCKERFLNDVLLQTHCSMKHNGNTESMAVINDKNGSFEFFDEEPLEFGCNTCTKIFTTQSNLTKHMKNVHFSEENPSLAAKHVIILSKSASLAGKETKDSKLKSIDSKSKPTSKSKSDPKNKDSDTAFYSELSGNIQFNLMHHIDGKLLSEKAKKDAAISSTEVSTMTNQSAAGSKVENVDSTIKSPSCPSQLDSVGKSSNNKGIQTSTQSEEKPKTTDTALNYTEDMSHLDIATQLTMKRNLRILNSTMSRAKSEGDTTQICGNIRLKRVKDLSKDLSLERSETLCAESFGDNSFETVESMGLSGFWVRPHNYVCVTCGSQSLNFWDMEDHKWNHHPNVKCSHYEFSENHLPGWEFFTSRTFEPQGVIETEEKPEVPSNVNNRSRCSKCRKSCSSHLELHRHMLECGMDTTWMLTLMPSPSKKSKEKKKWRPFGSRRRRLSRVRGLKRNIPNSPMKIIFPPKLNPKSKSGDTETIQKMIANLPAKRATRRVVIFDNVSRAGQATINSVPITNPNWNNNTYEDGLIENLLKNDQQGVPSTCISSATTDAASTNVESKESTESNSCVTDLLLSNSTTGTRIVPIWPPAEQSDVLTSLGMMPIPQIPMKIELPRPLIVTKIPEPEIKPMVPESPLKTIKPVKTKILRSVVRQLSASSLESSDSGKKLDKSEKSSASSSRSASPKVIEVPVKSSLSADKPFGKIPSAQTSPSKAFTVLPISSIKKPCDLATEKSTILDAMRIAMASSALVDSAFASKSTKTRKLLTKSLSESLLIGKDLRLKEETFVVESPFSCSGCNKSFKNGGVLKRHQVRCPSAKPIEDLADMPALTPAIEVRSTRLSELKTETSPNITAATSKDKENRICKSKSDTDSLLDQSSETEATSLKSSTLRAKKIASKEMVQDLVAVDGSSKLLRSKTISSSEVKAGTSAPLETKTKEKLSNLKEDSMPMPQLVADSTPEINDEIIETQHSGRRFPFSRKKVSIFQRTDKPKRGSSRLAGVEASTVFDTEEISKKLEKLSPLEIRSDSVSVNSIKENDASLQDAPKIDDLTPALDTSKNVLDDVSSDSDSDSTPLVQLKEIILKSSPPTRGKTVKKKVLVRKQRLMKARAARNRSSSIQQVQELVETKRGAGFPEVPSSSSAGRKKVKRNLGPVKGTPVEKEVSLNVRNSSKLLVEESAEIKLSNSEASAPSVAERKKVKRNLRTTEEKPAEKELFENGKNSSEMLVKESAEIESGADFPEVDFALSNTEASAPSVAERKKVKRNLRTVEEKLVDNEPSANEQNSSDLLVKESAEIKRAASMQEVVSACLNMEAPDSSVTGKKEIKRNLRPLEVKLVSEEIIQNEKNFKKPLVKESEPIGLHKYLAALAPGPSLTGRKKVKRNLRPSEAKSVNSEIPVINQPESNEESAEKIEEVDHKDLGVVSQPISSKQTDKVSKTSTPKKKRRKPKRLNPKTLKHGQWRKGRKAFIGQSAKNCTAARKNEVNSSQDFVAEIDELKDEIGLDDSFKLCLSEEDKDEAKNDNALLISASKSTERKIDVDSKTAVKDELDSKSASVPISDETSKEDSKPAVDSGETPPKPKRKRCSAYNLLFTHLKQEDMHELLTTIQADRQNLKRKCTLVDSQQATDKKPRKLVGKAQLEEDNAAEKEDPQQTENSDLPPIAVTETTDESIPTGSKKDFKKSSESKFAKKGMRTVSKTQTAKLRSRIPVEEDKNQTQTTLDEFITPKKQAVDVEVPTDSRNLVEESVTTVGTSTKTKHKQSTLDDWSSAASIQIASTPSVDPQPSSAVNRKFKVQKLISVETKSELGDELSSSEPKTVARAKLRSSANVQDENIAETVDEVHGKTSKSQSLLSARARTKKPSQIKISDAVSDVTLSESEMSDTKSANSKSKVDDNISALSKENVIVNNAETSPSLSKNVESNAKNPVHQETVVLNSELSNNLINSKKRKRTKKSIVKDVTSEATSDDDNVPLSSLSEETVASSLSFINSDETELSDFKPKSKKSCKPASTNSFDSADVEDTIGSDGGSENRSENFSPLITTKVKSKTLKRKRKKSLLQKNLLSNVDSPMTSDSDASILRVSKKQLKDKKLLLLNNEVGPSTEDNNSVANNLALRKQIAKLKKTKKLKKKVLNLINKGGKPLTETIEASNLLVGENSQSNESLSGSAIDIFRKKKLKKKKSKKKLKNLKDKDLVNVLVQTVAKTAKILNKKSSEQLLRKKQLKLQRKKALKVLSHVNTAWKISIVNQESNESLTSEIPDSSNDLEENKKEIESSSVNSNQSLVTDDTDSNQSVDKINKNFYCSLCDKDCQSLVTLNKHFLTWKHRYNKKLLAQPEPSDTTLKVSSFLNSPSFENTQISLSSLKNKLTTAAKVNETPAKVSEPTTVVPNVGTSAISDISRAFTSTTLSTMQPSSVSAEPLEPVAASNWSEQEWSSQGWQSTPATATAPVNAWLHDPWHNTNNYESAPSLGSILDSVNQILADPTAADPHADPVVGQYSLADLQQAMGASDEEMAMLQQLGQSSHPSSESEFVYDNSELQQGAQPAFNDWACESTDFLDLDNQHASEPTIQSKNIANIKELPEKVPSPAKKFLGSYGEYEDVEMTCPTATCSKRYHGLTALRTHIGWTHSNKLTNAFTNPSKELLASCMSNPTVIKSLACFVCKEVLTSQSQLDLHVSTNHVRKKLSDLVPGTSAASQSSEGAEKLKSKMSSAFGGLLDRALNKLTMKSTLKPPTASKEPSAVPAISNETLKFLGHLKEKRRMENIENKTFTSNLAKELRKMIDREKYEKHGIEGISSPRSSIDSDADVSSTTTKNEPPRLYSCPLCHNSFTTATNRNRHISVHHGRTTLETDEKYKPVEPPPEVINRPATPEKKLPEKVRKPIVKAPPKKKPTKKPDPENQIDSTVPDIQCDAHSSSAAAANEQLTAKQARAAQIAAVETALLKRHNLLSDDEDASTNCSDDNSSIKSFASKTQSSNNYSSDIETESNASQKSLIQSYQAALKITMRKKMMKQVSVQEEMAEAKLHKELLAEEDAKRQNEAFDMLIGKESCSKNARAPTKTNENVDNSAPVKSTKNAKTSTKASESDDDYVKLQAEAALKELTIASQKNKKSFFDVESVSVNSKKTVTDIEKSLSINKETIDGMNASLKNKKTVLDCEIKLSKNKKTLAGENASSKSKKTANIGENVSKETVVDGENAPKKKKTVVRKTKKIVSDDNHVPSKQTSKLSLVTNASIQKPSTSKVRKSFGGRKKKPLSSASPQSSKTKNAKKDFPLLDADSSKRIDISTYDSDSYKLTNVSFGDLNEPKPFSINSPNPNVDDESDDDLPLKMPTLKPSNSTIPSNTTQNKCDNISELEQLFSDDDSDLDTKIESPTKKHEEKINPEFLKSITAFRDSVKHSKEPNAAPTDSKNSKADVYNFEDEF